MTESGGDLTDEQEGRTHGQEALLFSIWGWKFESGIRGMQECMCSIIRCCPSRLINTCSYR